jgi:20S proteasome alpha/beta subunit
MTVCIAAISERALVIGLSDRMVTAGDIQSQPEQSKIVRLTNSIFAMYSGDVGLATDLLNDVSSQVSARLQKDPQNWLSVSDVAGFWADAYLARRARRAEVELLAPLGLSLSSFIQRQKALSEDIAKRLTTELLAYRMEDVDLIFGGVDTRGPALYVANNERIFCCSGIGFAAIGSGSYHARSQLLFAGYTPDASGPKAVSCLSMAKRRAEVAPGVGHLTDSIMVLGLGQTDTIHDSLMMEIRKACERQERKFASGFEAVEKKANEWIKKNVESRQTGSAQEQADFGEPSLKV